MLVLVVKSLIRLVYQKRQKILGSKLKSKLVFAMLVLVIIPTVPLYLLVGPTVNNVFDIWSQGGVDEALASSIDVSRAYLDIQQEYLLSRLSRFDEEFEAIRGERDISPSTREDLKNSIADNNFMQLIFLDSAGDVYFQYPDNLQFEKDEKLASMLKDQSRVSRVSLDLDSRVTTAYFPRIKDDDFLGIIVVKETIDPKIVDKIRMIERTVTDYKNLIKFRKRSYTFILNISFIIIGLVLLFLAFWIAFYIAKQITVPVEALLSGTERMSKGDLDFQIKVKTTDELGLLVESFNNMVREIKELNLANEKHTRFISSIIQNIGSGILAVTPDLEIVEVNQSAKKMFKLAESDEPGHLRDIFSEKEFEMISGFINECRQSARDFFHKEIVLNIKGKDHNFHFGVTTEIESVEGGSILVFDDITHVIHIQKIEVWRDVATQLAHEIKNPLTPIKLSAQRVLKKYKDDSSDFDRVLERSYSTIIQEVDNIKSLIDHFNAFSRLPSPNFEKLNLNQVITEVIDLYRNLENVKFVENLDDNIPLIPVDKLQIKRVLKNIIDNSLDSFLNKGRITVTTVFDPEENRVVITVEDNGEGIEKEDLEKVFLPYFSTKEKGMGLGMAIVEKIISEHNGQIDIDSQPYKGTKVEIVFFQV